MVKTYFRDPLSLLRMIFLPQRKPDVHQSCCSQVHTLLHAYGQANMLQLPRIVLFFLQLESKFSSLASLLHAISIFMHTHTHTGSKREALRSLGEEKKSKVHIPGKTMHRSVTYGRDFLHLEKNYRSAYWPRYLQLETKFILLKQFNPLENKSKPCLLFPL